MTTLEQIEKQSQMIARSEKSLALEKLKKRRADTRRKIQLGGLVVKAGMDGFSKAVILGVLVKGVEEIGKKPELLRYFSQIGEDQFIK